ncbi:hypothetical protein ScPMuIL_001227 [Solemya velum]
MLLKGIPAETGVVSVFPTQKPPGFKCLRLYVGILLVHMQTFGERMWYTSRVVVCSCSIVDNRRGQRHINMTNIQRTLLTGLLLFIFANGQIQKDANCGSTIGCFHYCGADNTCTFIVTWLDLGDGFIDFTITAKAGRDRRWFAIGFSDDDDMGDDSVTECIMDTDNTVKVYRSWDDDDDNDRLPAPAATLGLTKTADSNANGIFSCSFKQEKNPAGKKFKHSMNPSPQNSGVKVDLQQNTDVKAEPPEGLEGAIKTHAIFLLIGMLFATSIGTVLARFYKPVWKPRKWFGMDVWFQMHRAVMVVGLLFSVIGMIIIFAHVGEWSEMYDGAFQEAHPICGLITVILYAANPVMAIFRCAPTDAKRQIFNWAHLFVGISTHILGILTIFMGLTMEEVKAPMSAVYIMIVYVIYQVGIEVILEIYQHFYEGKGTAEVNHTNLNLEEKAGDATSDTGSTKAKGKSESSPGENYKIGSVSIPGVTHGFGFKGVVFYLHILILFIFTLTLLIMIAVL